nr:hypothetical protein JVH1_1640 [Rhodococcus sp. JVH1]
MTAAYASALRIPCPDCGAPEGVKCTLTHNGKTIVRHCPCLARVKASPATHTGPAPETAAETARVQRDITEPLHPNEESTE